MTASTKPLKNACGWAAPEPSLAAVDLSRLLILFLILAIWSAGPRPALAADGAAAMQVAAQVYADKGFEQFYNMDLDEAAGHYGKAIELEPENPDWLIGLAHVRMFQHLRAAGKIDAHIYGASSDLLPEPPPPDPAIEREMWDLLARARAQCEKRIAANDGDAQAHYSLGMSYAIESNFHVNARLKPFDALGPATKAKDHHLRVRELDPGNHDVNLVIGTYQYVIGSVPAAFRWILKLLGHSGSRELGIELLLDAAYNSKRVSPPALATLGYVYNREKEYGYSRRMLGHLVKFYPRSYIFPMEVAASFAREGDHVAAAEAYQEITQKFEAGAPGYHRHNAARLHFETAVTFEYARQYPQAAEAYDKALAALEKNHGFASPPSQGDAQYAQLHATVLLRLGHISGTLGEKEKARLLLEEAAASPFKEIQRAAKNRLKNLGN